MSTEQSVDPELVEQTKQQIRNLVREIAQISKSEFAAVEFYDAVLNRIVTALAAVGGAVWTVSEAASSRSNIKSTCAKPGWPRAKKTRSARPAAAQGHHQRRRHAGGARTPARATTKKAATRPTSCWCWAR